VLVEAVESLLVDADADSTLLPFCFEDPEDEEPDEE
jgi:hypothetical protein